MPSYFTNELRFDVPDTLEIEDRTVHLLEIDRGSGTPISLTVETSALAENDSIEEAARKLVTSRQVAVPAFTILDQGVEVTNGAPFMAFRVRFRGHSGLEYERQAHLRAGTRHVLVAVSCAMADWDYADQWFEHTMQTLHVRSE